MNFTCVNNEAFGARHAGFEIDLDADRIIDEEFAERLRKEGRGYAVENAKDGIFDFDSGLYQGEDGNFYAVSMAWDSDADWLRPLCWIALRKKEDVA